MAFTVLEAQLVAYGAGTDTPELVIGVVPEAESDQAWSVSKAALTSLTLMTGATAAAVTFTFGYSRAGAAVVPFATYVTILGADLPVNTEKQATLLAAATGLQAGDVIVLNLTHAGSGTAVPVGTNVRVELQ
jgi:hypothetical protein